MVRMCRLHLPNTTAGGQERVSGFGSDAEFNPSDKPRKKRTFNQIPESKKGKSRKRA